MRTSAYKGSGGKRSGGKKLNSKNPVNRVLKYTGISILVLLLILFIVPFLIPLNNYKPQIINLVKQKTGRELVITGDIKATILPNIGAEIIGLSIKNPEGFKEENLLTAKKIAVAVGLKAIINKKLEIKNFSIDSLEANLVNSKKHGNNWQFSADKTQTVADGSVDKEKKNTEENIYAQIAHTLAAIAIGNVSIKNSNISYNDLDTGKIYKAGDINLKASMPSIRENFKLDFDAIYNEEKLRLVLNVDSPENLIVNKESAFDLAISSKLFTTKYEGKAKLEAISGNLNLDVKDLPGTLKFATGANAGQGVPKILQIVGGLNLTPEQIDLKQATISADQNKISGDISVNLEDKLPLIKANLTGNNIKIAQLDESANYSNIFFNKSYESYLVSNAYAEETKEDKPVDLSFFKDFNLKAKIDIADLTYQKLKIEKILLEALVDNGVLKLDVKNAKLYGGQVISKVTIDALANFSKEVKLENVNIGDFLTDYKNIKKFQGNFDLDGNFSGNIKTSNSLLRTLDGKGKLSLKDGKIRGLEMFKLMTSVENLTEQNVANDDNAYTAFDSLAGSFNINKGVISNNDLELKSKLLNAKGAGTINLAENSINYRVTPVLSSKHQKAGISEAWRALPLLISGSLSKPNYRPDPQGLIKNVISDPNTLKNTINTIRGGLSKDGKSNSKSLDEVDKLLKVFGN